MFPVFDADAAKAMGEAFDTAKEIVAKRIVEAAKNGEHDPERLCAKALNGLNKRRAAS